MNVLQLQSDEGEGNEERDGSRCLGYLPDLSSSVESKEKSGRVVRSGTLESAASAQDILRELRDASSRVSKSNGRLGQEKYHTIRAASDSGICVDESCPFEHAPALALVPLRSNNVHRPYRLNRRGSSNRDDWGTLGEKPHHAVTTAAFVGTTTSSAGVSTTKIFKDVASKPKDARNGSIGFGNVSISETAVFGNVVGCSQTDRNHESPLERYRKAVGMNQDDSAPVKFSRVRGIFPKTSPSSTIPTMNRPQPPDSQFKSTNPFDSPPRCAFAKMMANPFEEQSSPILFTEETAAEHSSFVSGMCISYLSEKVIASPTNNDRPTLPPNSSGVVLLPPSKRDTPAQVSPPQKEEIQASIFQPKNNDAARFSKLTSTLVRNETSVNPENEDDDDVKLASLMETRLNNENYNLLMQQRNSMNESHNPGDHDTRATNSIKFMMKNQIMSESVRGDEAVEDAVAAVWAATDGFSITSATSNEVSTGYEGRDMQPCVEIEDEGEDFFVIRKPQHRELATNWTAFAADYNTDIYLSESKDEWYGGDQWDCNEDCGSTREEKVSNFSFASPSSVTASNRISF
jgi:hypothetical protein